MHYWLHPKLEASTHQATHHPSTTLEDTFSIPHPNTISARSILFGENGIAGALATCVRLIKSRMPGKAVMEVIFQGKRALAKFWSKEYYERFYIPLGNSRSNLTNNTAVTIMKVASMK